MTPEELYMLLQEKLQFADQWHDAVHQHSFPALFTETLKKHDMEIFLGVSLIGVGTKLKRGYDGKLFVCNYYEERTPENALLANEVNEVLATVNL